MLGEIVKRTPLLALVAITVALTAGVAYALNVALTIPANVNVVEVPTYWTSTTSVINCGDTFRGADSTLTTVRITNGGTTTQTLTVHATNLGTDVTLIVKTMADATYVPTALTAGAYIDLKIGVHVGASAALGVDSFNVVFESAI